MIARGARVAALSPCHSTNGARLDLIAISQACRAAGGALVVDASLAMRCCPASPVQFFRGGRDIALDDHLVLRHVREQPIGHELVVVM